jgi:O-antigen biosynthesis protein
VTQRRLLFVDVKWPTPATDAASQRTVQLVSELTALGFAVDLAAMFPLETTDQDVNSLELAGASRVPAAGEEALAEYAARHGGRYDVAVLCWTRVAERLLGALRRANPGISIVFDTVDVNHVREYRHARVSGNANILRRALAMKQAEISAARAADWTLAVTERDAEVLRAAAPGARIEVITLAASARGDVVPGPVGRSGALFLGHYFAWHNVDAAIHLARDVAPQLSAVRPGVRVTLAGAGRHSLVDDLASADVDVIGYVEDLPPLFDRMRSFACPLRIGSGIKGKLLTALAMGLPVVASPVAIEGMHLRDGVNCLVAENPAAVAAACVRLEDDDDLWRRISAGGLDVVERYFSPEAVRRQVRAVFQPLLAAPKSGHDDRLPATLPAHE